MMCFAFVFFGYHFPAHVSTITLGLPFTALVVIDKLGISLGCLSRLVNMRPEQLERGRFPSFSHIHAYHQSLHLAEDVYTFDNILGIAPSEFTVTHQQSRSEINWKMSQGHTSMFLANQRH